MNRERKEEFFEKIAKWIAEGFTKPFLAYYRLVIAYNMWAYDRVRIAPYAETSQPPLKDYVRNLRELERASDQTLAWIDSLDKPETDEGYAQNLSELEERLNLDEEMLNVFSWQYREMKELEQRKQQKRLGGRE